MQFITGKLQSIIKIASVAVLLFLTTDTFSMDHGRFYNTPAEPNPDPLLGDLSRQIKRYFNDRCADAWCAGDFDHTCFYADYQDQWILKFRTAQRFNKNFEIISEPGIPDIIATRTINSLESTCTFFSIRPYQLLEFDRGNFIGISQQMMEKLTQCITRIEQDFRAKFPQ
jgi:hypothetical protein